VRGNLGPETEARTLGGDTTDSEKTLLQQIRDKELELATTIEAARKEAEASVAAARAEAEDLLCTADDLGKKAAEQLYWKERGRTEIDIENLKKAAEQERKNSLEQGERNVPAAAEQIVRYVTTE